MKRKLIKIINKIIFHFLFWSVILAWRGTISVIITSLIRCLLYNFLSSFSLLPFLFSFLLFLIINLNDFIKYLGPDSGTLPSWQENRHILMLQKHLYYEPMPWPAQTLTLHIPPLQHHSLKGSFIPRARVDVYLGALKALCAWLWDCNDHIFRAHPFYPHLPCREAFHHPGMHLSGPVPAIWDTMLGMSFLCHLSLWSSTAKMENYLSADP